MSVKPFAHRVHGWLLTGVLTGSAVACGPGASSGPDAARCARNADCRDGFVCLDGRCETRSRPGAFDAGLRDTGEDGGSRPADGAASPSDGGPRPDAGFAGDSVPDGGDSGTDAGAPGATGDGGPGDGRDGDAGAPTGHGAPCESAASCGLGERGLCLRDTSRVGFPGGYCATPFLLICPAGSEAWLVDLESEAWCVAGCERADDCREGYVCGVPEIGRTLGDAPVCHPEGA